MPKKGYKQTEKHIKNALKNRSSGSKAKSKSLKKYYKETKNPKCGFQKGIPKSKNAFAFQKGHKHLEETKRKIGLKNKISLLGNKPWNIGLTKKINKSLKNASEKQKINIKKLWENKEYREKQIKLQLTKNRPTSFEYKIIKIIKKYNLPYIYTGNGSFLIGYKNPDFIHKEKKICIEVFYSYHKKSFFGSVNKYIKQRKKHFNKYKYQTIFINEDELNNEKIILKKLK